MGITSLWPWPLTQGHQFQRCSIQCGKQTFSENRVQIGSPVRLEFFSQVELTHRHTDTHTQTNWSENITLPRFCGSVKISIQKQQTRPHLVCNLWTWFHGGVTRSIQITQTPLLLWNLTFTFDLDLKSRPRKLMSLDVAYWIVPWYQVWCLWV